MATERFNFYDLTAGQADAYLLYNANLRQIEAMFGAVEAIANDPPVSPNDGQVWVVGSSPTGVWVGHDDEFAHWYNGAWHYYQPQNYQRHWNAGTNAEIQYVTGSGWS